VPPAEPLAAPRPARAGGGSRRLTTKKPPTLDTPDHAGDAVYDQTVAQEDALARAADGFVGALTTDDEFEAELYQAELEVAVDDLGSQAADFRDQGPEVRQAFYEGYQDGLAID
jgi:hypothetical protein